MSKPKPTPGPWRYEEMTEITSLGQWVVTGKVGDGNDDVCYTDSEENARFIASSPLFLDAALAWERAEKDGGASMADLSNIAMEKTRAALASYRSEAK